MITDVQKHTIHTHTHTHTKQSLIRPLPSITIRRGQPKNIDRQIKIVNIDLTPNSQFLLDENIT